MLFSLPMSTALFHFVCLFYLVVQQPDYLWRQLAWPQLHPHVFSDAFFSESVFLSSPSFTRARVLQVGSQMCCNIHIMALSSQLDTRHYQLLVIVALRLFELQCLDYTRLHKLLGGTDESFPAVSSALAGKCSKRLKLDQICTKKMIVLLLYFAKASSPLVSTTWQVRGVCSTSF